MRSLPLLSALLAGVLAACSDLSTSLVCPGEPDPALQIAVLDAATSASITTTARGTFTVGTLSDSLRHGASRALTVPVAGQSDSPPPDPGAATRLHAFGPPGSYQVSVSHDGYAGWSTSVQVSPDMCDVGTVELNVPLAR